MHRGDLELEDKKGDEAAATYLKAQIMITALYGSDHPMIIYYNAAIIDAKQIQGRPGENNQEINRIAEKNLEIAEESYGKESIYLLKHILNIASTHI